MGGKFQENHRNSGGSGQIASGMVLIDAECQCLF